MPHRDELQAAQERVRALEDKVRTLEEAGAESEAGASKAGESKTKNSTKSKSKGKSKGAASYPAPDSPSMTSRQARARDDVAIGAPGWSEVYVYFVGTFVFVAMMFANTVVTAYVEEAVGHSVLTQSMYGLAFGLTVVGILLGLSATAPRILWPSVALIRFREEDGMFTYYVRRRRPTWALLSLGLLGLNALAYVAVTQLT